MGCFPQFLHSGTKEFGGKVQEPEGLEDTKETRPSRSTGLMQMWTHRDQGSMHRDYIGLPKAKRRIEDMPLSLAQKPSSVDNHLQKDI